jgi:hypothetical protein
MPTLTHGELQVVVPVGFLLAEEQEVTVSVARADGESLPVRLKLIPARPVASAPMPEAVAWPLRANPDDRFAEIEYGGGD